MKSPTFVEDDVTRFNYWGMRSDDESSSYSEDSSSGLSTPRFQTAGSSQSGSDGNNGYTSSPSCVSGSLSSASGSPMFRRFRLPTRFTRPVVSCSSSGGTSPQSRSRSSSSESPVPPSPPYSVSAGSHQGFQSQKSFSSSTSSNSSRFNSPACSPMPRPDFGQKSNSPPRFPHAQSLCNQVLIQRFKTSPLVTSEIQNAWNGDSSSLDENKENELRKFKVPQKKKRVKKKNVPILNMAKSFEKFDEIRRKRNASNFQKGFKNCCPRCKYHESNGSLPDLSKDPETGPQNDQLLCEDSTDSGFNISSNPVTPFSPVIQSPLFKFKY